MCLPIYKYTPTKLNVPYYVCNLLNIYLFRACNHVGLYNVSISPMLPFTDDL